MRLITGFLPAAAAAACALPALAWAADDVASAVKACRAEPDDARRLACYDRAAGRGSGAAPVATASAATAAAAKSATAAPAAAAPVAAPAGPAQPPPPATPEDNFGRERQLAYEEDKKREEATRTVGELRASIISIETRMDGLMTFTLDNGQVWRQNRPDSRFSIRLMPCSTSDALSAVPSEYLSPLRSVKV